MLTDALFKKWDADVKEQVEACEKFAENSPYPEKQLLYDMVYEEKFLLKHSLKIITLHS